MPIPPVLPRIEQRHLFCRDRIKSGDMSGFVSIARNAGQSIIAWIIRTATNQRNDVLYVISPTGNDLRSPAIFATRLSPFRDEHPFQLRRHSSRSRWFTTWRPALALRQQQPCIIKAHAVGFLRQLPKLLPFAGGKFPVIVLRH